VIICWSAVIFKYLTAAPAFVGIMKVGIARMMPARVVKVLLDVVLLPTATVVAQLYSHLGTTTK